MINLISKKELIFAAITEKCRRDFWYYCKTMAPDFYREDRPYLKHMCKELQAFYESDEQVMCVNLPPRHGKSRTATLFVQWVLGNDNYIKIMTGSYNETLSTTFSKQVRGAITEVKADEDRIIYSDIFPTTRIKYGEGAANLWTLEGQSNANYLATSPTGTATGFGADIELIDDLVKSALEARNINTLNQHWDWFTNTMLSRLQGKRKVILIMTRWSDDDLCGKALVHYKRIGIKVRLLTMKAYDGVKMLCDDILNKPQYDTLVNTLGEDIAEANYNQTPVNIKGVMYERLQTYDKLPEDIKGVYNYTDTADTGSDNLCSINYAVSNDNKAYITDITYTKEAMEVTEPLVAKMLLKGNVNYADIESNNGGRGFSRNVERITKELGNRKTIFKTFHQSQNKQARIFAGSTNVMNNVLFPSDWAIKWPQFYSDTIRYQREGKNEHDDNADALTGVTEMLEKRFIKRGNLSGQRL